MSAVEFAMPASRVRRAYWMESKYETVRMLRTPAMAIPFLSLPVALYLLFGVVIFGEALRKDPQAGAFVFTAFTVLGAMGPGMFGFGVAVAMEREQGSLQFKRALPMPPAAYLFSKMFMALIFGVIIVVSMLAAAPFGNMQLGPAQTAMVTIISILGALPFCAIGLLTGTLTTSRSAPAIVNVLYQVMMHTSGLLYPVPGVLRAIAPIWPTYHLQQLMLSVTGGTSQGGWMVHTGVLAGTTLLFTAMAVRRLARHG